MFQSIYECNIKLNIVLQAGTEFLLHEVIMLVYVCSTPG